jgi:D-xylose transport system ATP-binding protein
VSAPTARPDDGSTPTLELRGVNKSFGAVQVLTDVHLTVHPGQVTALVGDNGAGKSTLIKSIAGIHPIDSGEFLFEGRPVSISGPRDAAPSASRSSTRTSRSATTSTSSRTCSSAGSA